MADRVIRIILTGNSAGAVAAMAETGAAAEKTTSKIDTLTRAGGGMKSLGHSMTALAVPFLAVGAYAVKTASDFQTSMTLIRTQAHQSQGEVNLMTNSILRLAPTLGTSTAALADSAYHIESAGFHGAQALKLMTIAAKEAQVSGADLTDTTTALTAAVFSGIKGAQNYTQAMGLLNATVGAGDMHFQDLNEAFAGPMLATVKGYGLSLRDVGSALATFGDLNMRGADAATALRMAVQYMARPASTAGPLLQQLGLNTQSFANAMAKGGLLPALQLLHNRLDAAGIKGNEVASVISQLFSKKGAAGVTILENSLPKLESKYPVIDAGAGSLTSDFAARTKNVGFQWDRLKATVQVALIGIGNALMPIVKELLPAFADAIKTVAHWFTGLPKPVKEVVVALVAVLAIGGPILMFLGALATAIAALDFLASPWTLIVLAVVAFVAALIEAYNHVKWFRDFVDGAFKLISGIVVGAVNFIRDHWQLILSILTGPIGAAIIFIVTHFNQVVGFFASLPGKIGSAFSTVGNIIAGIFGGVVNVIIDGINIVIKALDWLIRRYNDVVGSIPIVGGDLTVGQIGTIGHVHFGATSPTPKTKTSSQSVGSQSGNSVNQPGHSTHHPASIILQHTTRLGNRVVAEETVHYAAKRTSLGGAIPVH